MNGQYWESPHFTKEYIVFLKIKPTETWWMNFIGDNSLLIDSTEWNLPTDAPDWFQPPSTSISYGFGDEFNKSRYFKDTVSGECYIYEIQF